MLVHASCAVMSCPLVNESQNRADKFVYEFSDFYLPIFHLFSAVRVIPSSCWFHVWYWEIRTTGLQSSEGRMMIDSVVWAQYINVTDRQTDSHVAVANVVPWHGIRLHKSAVIQHNREQRVATWGVFAMSIS